MLQVLRDNAVRLLEVAPEDLSEDKRFAADLQVDSLSLVLLTMDLEDSLGVEVSEDDVADATTVGALADVLLAKVNG